MPMFLVFSKGTFLGTALSKLLEALIYPAPYPGILNQLLIFPARYHR